MDVHECAWQHGAERNPELRKGALSYGETGQEPGRTHSPRTRRLAAAASAAATATVTKATQGGFGGLLSSGTRGNPDLKPERQKEVEAGVDLGFFNQRADAGITHYNTHSTDVILSVPRPPTSGFSAQQLNGAALRSKGWEATVNLAADHDAPPHAGTSVCSGRRTRRPSKISRARCSSVAGGGSFAEASPQAVAGGSFVYRGLGFARCGMSIQSALRDNRNAVITDFDAACAGKATGTLYVDSTGFPVKDPNIRQVADPNPKWTGGLHSSVTFGRWQLSALVDHKQGGQIMNTTKGSLYNFGTHKDTEKRDVNEVFGTDLLPGAVTGPAPASP